MCQHHTTITTKSALTEGLPGKRKNVIGRGADAALGQFRTPAAATTQLRRRALQPGARVERAAGRSGDDDRRRLSITDQYDNDARFRDNRRREPLERSRVRPGLMT